MGEDKLRQKGLITEGGPGSAGDGPSNSLFFFPPAQFQHVLGGENDAVTMVRVMVMDGTEQRAARRGRWSSFTLLRFDGSLRSWELLVALGEERFCGEDALTDFSWRTWKVLGIRASGWVNPF